MGDFLFWGFFLLFPSIRLTPFVHSPLPPHRIIIRQIRLSAASLHDMPSLACGASLDMVPAPSLANTLVFTLPPTHIDGLPAPQAFHPQHHALFHAPCHPPRVFCARDFLSFGTIISMRHTPLQCAHSKISLMINISCSNKIHIQHGARDLGSKGVKRSLRKGDAPLQHDNKYVNIAFHCPILCFFI